MEYLTRFRGLTLDEEGRSVNDGDGNEGGVAATQEEIIVTDDGVTIVEHELTADEVEEQRRMAVDERLTRQDERINDVWQMVTEIRDRMPAPAEEQPSSQSPASETTEIEVSQPDAPPASADGPATPKKRHSPRGQLF